MGENMNDERVQRYAEAIEEMFDDLDAGFALEIADAVVAVADAEQAELRADAERWTEKAQEAGAAYALANSKRHAELDRASRLERLADTLAATAVNLEDRARAAERALADERAKVALTIRQLDSLIEVIDEADSGEPVCHDYDRIDNGECALLADLRRVRAALDDPEPEAFLDEDVAHRAAMHD
jgi:hypothetical protein